MGWRNHHIYYTDLDKLILECAYPILQQHHERLETCFWERHYAGGPHLRIRLRGTAEALEAVDAELLAAAKQYITSHPSTPLPNYSRGVAEKLLEMEDEKTSVDDLDYRVNEIVERPYQRLKHKTTSDEAAALLEDFLHVSMPLAVELLSRPQEKLEQVLRLYFLQALFVARSLPPGCVTYKSHWEGFSALRAPRDLSERIKLTYLQQREYIRFIMLEVNERFEKQTINGDPILSRWNDLLVDFRERTDRLLKSGIRITNEFSTIEEVRESVGGLRARLPKDNPFLRAFSSDECFLLALQYDDSISRPRVLTNLLYSFLSGLGLTVVDRMSLCYYAHKAVEDYFQKDLTEILDKTIDRVLKEFGRRPL